MLFLQLIEEILFLAAYVSGGGSFPEPLSEEEERVAIAALVRGDTGAREKLIEHNLRLVAHIARKYVRQGRESDDVISIGTIGLIKAVSTYKPDRGKSLSAYASRCIENEILMSIRTEKRQVQEVPFQNPIGTDDDGNDISILDVLGTDMDAVEREAEGRIESEQIHRLIATHLNRREAMVIRLRFGIGCAGALTQREVADILGISRSYVSRIEKKAIEKLGAAMP